MSATGPESDSPAQARSRFALDPVGAAMLCMFAAAGAAAFATVLSPHGYRQWSRLTGALLLGLLVSLLLRLALKALLARRFAIAARSAAYAAMAGALILLLVAAGARTLVSRTSGEGAQASDRARAQQAFRRWTMQAVPLLVRYKATLAADASPSVTEPASGDVAVALLARVEHARRRLLELEPAVRRLARGAPLDLRPFMPLLSEAVALAAAAQGRYEAALAARGSRSRALHRQASNLLRRSQQAMAAFSIDVNGVGGQLANG